MKSRNPHDIRVVITGVGTINPIGNNVQEFWDNLSEGKSGIRRIQNVEIDDFPVQIGAEVDFTDYREYFKTKNVQRKLDRFIIFGHIAGSQAVRDSGIDIDKAPHRYGSLIGTGDAGVKAHNDNIKRIVQTGMQSVSPYYITSAIPSTGSAYFAKEWNLQGPSFSVSSACSTCNYAIAVAASFIKMGIVDAMYTGGSEAPVNEPGLAAFDKIFALSSRNDSPETASRPYDRDRDGFVLGEGSGVLCLEELEHAKKRGARIYAEVTGVGMSCDAHDLVAPDPDARGAARAMKLALDSAGLNPQDVGLINCHATSTPLGDTAESVAINKVFGNYTKEVPVHSTKSMIGHLLGGASAVEAVACILALEKGIIHPSINLFELDPKINLNVVKQTQEDGSVDHVLSNSFGFGGQNAVVVISRFTG